MPQSNQNNTSILPSISIIGSNISIADSALQAGRINLPGSRFLGPLNSTITATNYLDGNISGEETSIDIAVDIAIFTLTQATNAQTGFFLTGAYCIYKGAPSVWDTFVTTMTPPVSLPR